MRVIGGTLRGRRFAAPEGDRTRPTSDRVREAVASSLASRQLIREASVLDLFAGTGAYSFEAISRGARSALLVEKGALQCRFIDRNIQSLRLGAMASCVAFDLLNKPWLAAQRLARHQQSRFDLVFVDPPYAHVQSIPPLLSDLCAHGALEAHATIVLERSAKSTLDLPKGLTSDTQYRYGDTVIEYIVRDLPIRAAKGSA